jgi:hypothetical protein
MNDLPQIICSDDDLVDSVARHPSNTDIVWSPMYRQFIPRGVREEDLYWNGRHWMWLQP